MVLVRFVDHLPALNLVVMVISCRKCFLCRFRGSFKWSGTSPVPSSFPFLSRPPSSFPLLPSLCVLPLTSPYLPLFLSSSFLSRSPTSSLLLPLPSSFSFVPLPSLPSPIFSLSPSSSPLLHLFGPKLQFERSGFEPK